jgi:hypothetical protein
MRIDFTSDLPAAHQALSRAMLLGSVIKVQAVFARPFWRDEGWSGVVVDDTSPFGFMADNSHPEQDVAVLVTFVSAAAARAWGDAALGSSVTSVRQERFSEHLRSVDALRNSAARARGSRARASSESATMWTGYIDGAIQSGLRAAPIAMISGSSQAARAGAVVKGGAALGRLAACTARRRRKSSTACSARKGGSKGPWDRPRLPGECRRDPPSSIAPPANRATWV